jgi:hypothetical protein
MFLRVSLHQLMSFLLLLHLHLFLGLMGLELVLELVLMD